MMKTLSGLVQDLRRHDQTLPLVFETQAGEISPGYHVTELKHLTAKGIDCGGSVAHWQEATVQLLDGHGGDHMSVAKFSGIVSKSLLAMPELGDVSLEIEFGHDNKDLRRMSLGDPVRREGRVVIALGEARALCKPAARVAIKDNPSKPASACCAKTGTPA